MTPTDVYGHIALNNRKIASLVLLFPTALLGLVYLFFLIMAFFSEGPLDKEMAAFNDVFMSVVPFLLLFCTAWTLLSFSYGGSMMLKFAGAKPCLYDKDNMQIYRLVENLALKAGVPCPNVYLIPDDSLNAFATGYDPKNASIALTTGIVKKLSPLELEAVLSHEMAHIINRDIRLNMFVITGIGIIGMVGEILIRSSNGNNKSSSSKKGNGAAILVLIGLAFLLFRYLIAPFIHMALSRSQEYQADATGAYLTRNPAALASALKKVAEDPRVEALDRSEEMACACICNPLKRIGGLLDTHPPIEERIKRLESMV